MINRAAYVVLATSLSALYQLSSAGLALAQAVPGQHWGIHGQYDAELPPPAIEGKAGEKDPAALSEIREFAASTTPSGWRGIEANGTLLVGDGQTIKEFPASLIVQSGAKYRLDVTAGSAASSVRVNGLVGVRQQSNGTLQRLNVTLLDSPFFVPSELLEIANRANISVVDDGQIQIEKRTMHKITLVIPAVSANMAQPITNGSAFAVGLYFDPVKHYLLKKVMVGHYPGQASRQFLQVTTYNDYRQMQGAIVPFVISQTNNGQHGMTFKATDLSETARHEESYFRF